MKNQNSSQLTNIPETELSNIHGGIGENWSYTDLGVWWSGGGAAMAALAIVGGPVGWVALAGGLAFAALGGGLIYAESKVETK